MPGEQTQGEQTQGEQAQGEQARGEQTGGEQTRMTGMAVDFDAAGAVDEIVAAAGEAGALPAVLRVVALEEAHAGLSGLLDRKDM